MYKILVESDTGSGAVFQKTYPKLIYLERVFKNLYAGNEHFFITVFLVSIISKVFLKNLFSKFEYIGN